MIEHSVTLVALDETAAYAHGTPVDALALVVTEDAGVPVLFVEISVPELVASCARQPAQADVLSLGTAVLSDGAYVQSADAVVLSAEVPVLSEDAAVPKTEVSARETDVHGDKNPALSANVLAFGVTECSASPAEAAVLDQRSSPVDVLDLVADEYPVSPADAAVQSADTVVLSVGNSVLSVGDSVLSAGVSALPADAVVLQIVLYFCLVDLDSLVSLTIVVDTDVLTCYFAYFDSLAVLFYP